jgi:hypothetical protein
VTLSLQSAAAREVEVAVAAEVGHHRWAIVKAQSGIADLPGEGAALRFLDQHALIKG